MMCRLLLGSACLLAPGALVAQTGQPQDATSPPAVPGTAPAVSGVGAAPAQAAGEPADIIVTAQRRSERLEQVPIAITSIGGDTLAAANVSATAQLPQLVPALRIDYAGAFAQPTIRGVGSAAAGNGLSPNVATYIDGFYQPSAQANDFQLLSVTNVSVLKGPQGTLFGRNATGGAILVTTRDPSFTPTAQFNIAYARFGRLTSSAYVSAGLTDTLAMDVSAIYERGNGFVTNVLSGDDHFYGFRKYIVRSKLLFRPDDATSVVLTYQHNDSQDPTPQGGVLRDGAGLAQVIPGAVIATGRRESSESFRPAFDLNIDSIFLKGERDLGFATLTSLTQLRYQDVNQKADEDRSSIPVFDYSFFYKQTSFSQEINLTSREGGPFTWVLGAYYFHDNDRQPDFLLSLGGGPFLPGYRTQQKTSALAGFVDATYEVASGLFLTGGVRYSHEKRQASFSVQSAAVGVVGTAAANEDSFDSFTPRAVIRYELSPRTNVYASFTKGFKSGAFNPSGQDVSRAVDPEKIDAYEVGFKSASSLLRFSSSAYYYDYKGLQLSSYIGASSFLRNAANARIYGADADLTVTPVPNLSLKLAGAYTNARFLRFPNAPSYVQCLSLAACGAGYGAFVTVTVDARGRSLARAPEFTGNVGAEYTLRFGDSSLTLNGDYYRTSRVFFDPVEQYSQKGYGILNLRATYHLPGDRVSVSVFGTNVTDTVYVNQVLPQPPFGTTQTYGEPASYGAALSFRF